MYQAIRLDRYELTARREINRILIQDAEEASRRTVEAELRDPRRGEYHGSLCNPHDEQD